MKLFIERKYRKESYTIGELFVNGKYFCDTLDANSSSGAESRAPKTPQSEERGEAWDSVMKKGGLI